MNLPTTHQAASHPRILAESPRPARVALSPSKAPVPLDKLTATSFNGSVVDALIHDKRGVFPAGPQVSVALNPLYDAVKIKEGKTKGKPANYGKILPWSDPRIGKQVPGCAPEQVHLAWYDTQDSGPSVLVSWATCDGAYKWEGADANTAAPALSTEAAKSIVWVGTTPGVFEKKFQGEIKKERGRRRVRRRPRHSLDPPNTHTPHPFFIQAPPIPTPSTTPKRSTAAPATAARTCPPFCTTRWSRG